MEDPRIKTDVDNMPETNNQRQEGDNGDSKRTANHHVHFQATSQSYTLVSVNGHVCPFTILADSGKKVLVIHLRCHQLFL